MKNFTTNLKGVFEYTDNDVRRQIYLNDRLIYSDRLSWNALEYDLSLGGELTEVLRKMDNPIYAKSPRYSIEKVDDRPTKRGDCLGFFKKLRRCKFFTK